MRPSAIFALAAVIAPGLVGCKNSKAAETRAGAWREQVVFVGDDGAVLPLVVQMPAQGPGEAKAWLGRDGAWRSNFYTTFPRGDRDPGDLAGALAAWSKAPGAPVRVDLDHHGHTLRLALRTRSVAYHLDAPALRTLGTATDPEGTSRYAAGRATLTSDSKKTPGWVLIESTPRDRPRRPFVDYGDFVFVVAAAPGGPVLVAKHARDRAGFDHGFSAGHDGTLALHDLDIRREPEHLTVRAAGLRKALDFRVRDRSASTGVAPGGDPIVYEVALLDGPATGVAFAIHPARPTAKP